jgi:hypothetical protein
MLLLGSNNDLSTARLQDADSHGHSSHFSVTQQFVHSVPFHKTQYQSATNICQFYVGNEVVLFFNKDQFLPQTKE